MRSKIVLKNIVSNLIFQVVSVISGLLVPLLIIQTYGSEINGLNASISQAISYLHLVEAGIGMASIQALYSPLAKRDWGKVNGILTATKHLYHKSGILFLLLVFSLAIIYPVFIAKEIDTHISIGLVLVIGLGGVVEYFLHGKYRVLLLADQKAYIIFYIQTFAVIISTAIKVLMILNGFDIVIVQLVTAAIFVLRVLVLKIYIKKFYSKISYYSIPNKDALKKKYDVFIHQIAFLVLNNTDILLISIFLSMSVVSVYSIYNLVFMSIGGLVASFASVSLSAAFGNLFASEDKNSIKRSYNDYEYIYFVLLFSIYTITLVLTLPFIALYTANVFDVNYIDEKLPVLFTLVGLLNHIRNPSVSVINATGHFKETKYRAVLEAVINLVLSIILIQMYGLYGVLYGTIIAFLYRTSDTIFYVNSKILHQKPNKSLYRILANFIIMLSIAYILNNFYIFKFDTWIQWIVNTILISTIVIFTFIIINVIFEPKTMSRVFKRIKLLKNFN